MANIFQGRLVTVRIILLAAVLALTAAGIITIYSVGHPSEGEKISDLSNAWKKQFQFAAIALAGFFAINSVSYRKLGEASYWIFAVVIVLLMVLLVDKFIDLPFVPIINGTRRWIRIKIAGISLPAIQPSEFCKLAYVMALAWYLRYRSNYRNFTALIGPFLLTLLPMVLILLEPDLGTVMLMMPVLFMMLFIAGAKVKHLLIIVSLAALLSPILWLNIKPYQRIRISSVLLQNQWIQEKAELHPALGEFLVGKKFSKKEWKNDWGYHLIRSKYAIASGREYGYGFRQGPFIKYNFLPERHNDFIFAIIAHQWGFWGCMAILFLYSLVIWCGLEIAAHNTDPYGRLLAVGISVMFTVEILINISMTIGLMPITGLTLPFISYGGSSLLICMLAVGLLNNIGKSRPFNLSSKQI